MPFKIVRNDITKMNTDAIVNTANSRPIAGPGCDYAIYCAAGFEQLMAVREKIGGVSPGEVFITPGFHLQAKYIIHAVSPRYRGNEQDAEKKMRSCYRKSLELAKKYGIKSIAFPLIATGSFHYPKEEGLRIAMDEIHAFLLKNDMLVYLVVFDEEAANLGNRVFPDLEEYISRTYVDEKQDEEYVRFHSVTANQKRYAGQSWKRRERSENYALSERLESKAQELSQYSAHAESRESEENFRFGEADVSALEERMKHLSDTYQQYLFYLIERKGMTNAEVHKRAIVDKKVFSKIKNNPNYHPKKLTALCLCVGAKLNLDETKDLLRRAGYALSPCDKTDVIFSYFIEKQIYDMIEIDIQLEEHGLPCIIE